MGSNSNTEYGYVFDTLSSSSNIENMPLKEEKVDDIAQYCIKEEATDLR